MKKKFRALAVILSILALPSTLVATATTGYATDSTNNATLTITSVGEPTLAPATDVNLTVAITNPQESPMHITSLDIHAQNWPATSVEHVASWMAGSKKGYLLHHEAVDISLPGGQTLTQTITVPRADIAWHSSAQYWGPRGISVQATTEDNRTLSDRSYLVVTPDATLPPAPLTAVVPIVDTALPQPQDFHSLLSRGLSQTSVSLSEEDAAVKRNTTIAAWDMPGVTVLRVPTLASDAPTHNADEQLLPAYDADLAAFAHSDNANRASAYTQPYHSDVFLARQAIDTQTLQTVQQARLSAAIIPDSLLTLAPTAHYTPAAHTSLDVNGQPLSILTANATLSQAIAGTITDRGTTVNLDALDRRQTSLALSAVLYREQPNRQRSVVVVIDPQSVTAQETELRETVAALTAAPWNVASGVTEILAQPATSFRYEALADSAPAPGEFTAADLEKFDAVWANTTALSKIFAPSPQLDRDIDAYLDNFMSTQWRSDPDQRSRYLQTVAITDPAQIKVEKSSTINLISKNSALPIHVTNNYTYPVHVLVDFRAPDTRLRARAPAKVTIAAQSTQQVSVPVTAWGSGDINVTINVKNDDGDIIGSPENVYVRVRAGWESTGTAVVATIIGILFLAGVVTSIRKGRRSQPVDARLARALHQQRLAQED